MLAGPPPCGGGSIRGVRVDVIHARHITMSLPPEHSAAEAVMIRRDDTATTVPFAVVKCGYPCDPVINPSAEHLS